MLRFECPGCGKRLKVEEENAHRQMRCPDCGKAIAIFGIIEEDRLPRSKLPKVPLPEEDDSLPEVEPVRPARRFNVECPFCGEDIKVTARKCKHCGEFLDSSRFTRPAPSASGLSSQRPTSYQMPPNADPNLVYPAGHNPGLMAVLSVLLVGLGQMVMGQVGKGLVMLLAALVIGAITFGVGAIAVWAVSGIDAYLIAQKLERGQAVGKWEFF